MITTTLKKIRAHRPCGLRRGSGEGYDLLRKNLGKGYGDNTPVKFSHIVESNGLTDALWCLCSICPEYEKEVRLLAADYAERVLHVYESKYPDDVRPGKVIQAARDYANGLITKDDLEVARAAALDTARAAAWAAARDTAWAAARAAARAAAWDAAWASERQSQIKLLIERFS